MTIDKSKPEVFDESRVTMSRPTDEIARFRGDLAERISEVTEHREWVPFAEVVQAYYAAVVEFDVLLRSAFNSGLLGSPGYDPEAKARAEQQARIERFEALKRRFESRNGNIRDSYFSKRQPWGVVLTRQEGPETGPGLDIHRTGPETNDATIYVVDLLLMCDQLTEQTRSNLSPRESDRFVPVVFGIVKQLMSLADYMWQMVFGVSFSGKGKVAAAKEKSVMGTPLALAVLKARLGVVREAYEARLQRRLRASYLSGMMLSVLSIVALGASAGFYISRIAEGGVPGPREVGLGAACLISGSLGAFISVLIRMTSGKFRLPLMIGSGEVRNLGLLRPFIGAIFGLAFYVLVVSGLIPIQVPSDALASLFFYPGLAFLAGFSERLAQDAFGRASDQLAAAADGARLGSTRTEESV